MRAKDFITGDRKQIISEKRLFRRYTSAGATPCESTSKQIRPTIVWREQSDPRSQNNLQMY